MVEQELSSPPADLRLCGGHATGIGAPVAPGSSLASGLKAKPAGVELARRRGTSGTPRRSAPPRRRAGRPPPRRRCGTAGRRGSSSRGSPTSAAQAGQRTASPTVPSAAARRTKEDGKTGRGRSSGRQKKLHGHSPAWIRRAARSPNSSAESSSFAVIRLKKRSPPKPSGAQSSSSCVTSPGCSPPQEHANVTR